MPKIDRKNFHEYFQQASPDAIDFLDKTLVIDPDNRYVTLTN